MDQSTPLLYTALVNNEKMTTFELQFWTAQKFGSGNGIEKQHYTIRLTNARICDIRFTMPNNKNPELARYAEYEEVSFTYQKIEWIWNQGNKIAMDDWETS